MENTKLAITEDELNEIIDKDGSDSSELNVLKGSGINNIFHSSEKTDEGETIKETDTKSPNDSPNESESKDSNEEATTLDTVATSSFDPNNPTSSPSSTSSLVSMNDLVWSIKQTFSKRFKLNNTQLGIIYNVMKNGNFGLNYYKFSPGVEQYNTDSSTEMEYAINKYSGEVGTLYHRYYHQIENIQYFDFMNELFDYMNEGKILLVQNQHKAEIFTNIEENKTTASETSLSPSMTDVAFVLSKIKNGIIYNQPKSDRELLRLNELTRTYPQMIAYKSKHVKCTKYTRKSAATKYVSPLIKLVNKITLIPKDLQQKFYKPGKYFDEVKNVLKLNPETGFYSYKLDDLLIPILCTHEYMTYDGKSPSEISIECYKKGKCKYCGQELMAYHEQYKENLPPKIYDLIYRYIGTISENIEESALMYSLFTLIYDAIQENINKADVKNYDATVVAFSALYLYAIYTNTKETINYNNHRINRFLDSAKKYWSEVGWTNDTIEEAINDSPILSNMKNVEEIIKEKIYKNEIKFSDLLPVSTLFDKNIEPKDYDKLEPKSETQKLWKTGKMENFNKLFDKAQLILWKFVLIKNFIDKMSKEKIKVNFEIPNIKQSTVKNGEKFFFASCGTYCPASEFHVFSSGACKFCGIKKDLSNKKDIYNKFQNVINNSYLQEPYILSNERFKIDKLYHKKDIEAYKADDLFEKYLVIDNHVLKQSLNKSIEKGEHLDETLNFISGLTTIEINDLDKTPEFIKKSICFIIDKKIKSVDDVLNELKNIYFKIKSVDWLFV